MESIGEAVDRLTREGYGELFRAETSGVRAVHGDRLYTPDDLVVEEVVRFEGQSDPADEVIIFALRSDGDGTRGTLIMPYGSDADPMDVMVSGRLRYSADCRHH